MNENETINNWSEISNNLKFVHKLNCLQQSVLDL